jgi:hypothetical protein
MQEFSAIEKGQTLLQVLNRALMSIKALLIIGQTLLQVLNRALIDLIEPY